MRPRAIAGAMTHSSEPANEAASSTTLWADPNALFIIQVPSTLTTGAGSQVVLSGGADALNVTWVVLGSADLGAASTFKGSILAGQSITPRTGAGIEGRALARSGAVTLDNNTITAR